MNNPLYDLVEETHFIKVLYFLVLVNTPADLEFSTFYGHPSRMLRKGFENFSKSSWNS